MSVTAIWDIHWRDNWKKIVENTDTEHVVFVGDYFDSPNISWPQQIENFSEILEFKETTTREVTLLVWNHDFHYFSYNSQEYSWYGERDIDITQVWQLLYDVTNQWLLQVTKLIDWVLYSHAGVTNEWCDDYDIDRENIQESIGRCFFHNPQAFQFLYQSKKWPYRSWEEDGDDTFQSPFWIRPRSLEKDRIWWVKQVVGHTKQACITLSRDEQIAYIDTLGQSGEYLIVKDARFHIQGRDFLSIQEREEVMSLFEKKDDGDYMKYHEDFEFLWYTNGQKPTRIMFYREWEVLGTIWTREIKMPTSRFIMDMYTKEEARIIGYHFKIKEIE